MPSSELSCTSNGCKEPVIVTDKGVINTFLFKLAELYRHTTAAGENAAQYWADIAINSEHPLAPLANVPGAFAALWTPDTAPATATVLTIPAIRSYGLVALPKNLTHFTTVAGARGIAASKTINATRFGLFGPGVYMTTIGRPVNLFVQATARTPIVLKTPAGTVRIIPRLVYVRWGFSPVVLP
jgi:hypothetical protein